MESSRRRARRGEAQSHFVAMLAQGDRTVGCWVWPFARNHNGYGTIADGRGGSELVHRAAFRAVTGRDPQTCRHSCDNPPCFNPAHLLDGTQLENSRDSRERGRMALGERRGAAKLTEADVRQIRRLLSEGWSNKELAARYGVAAPNISTIRTGKAWTHVA